ncbi:Thioesterase superfamily protein [Apiospora saccharicola]
METRSGNSDAAVDEESSSSSSSYPEEVQRFMRIPWCAKYLSPTTTATTTPGGRGDLVVRVHENRTVLSSWQNQFVGGTLNTPDTIAGWVDLFPAPGPRRITASTSSCP